MMNDTFMKEKPVLPLILSMSLPMVLSMLVNSLYNITALFGQGYLSVYQDVELSEDSRMTLGE